MDREKILQRFDQELERMTAGMIMDRITSVEETDISKLTDFLDPFQLRTTDKVLHFFKDLKQIVWGGYAGAERARVMLFPAAKQATAANVPLAFLEAKVSGEAIDLSHRDYLGALLGLGLRREKIGDIIVSSTGEAQIVVHPEIQAFLLAHWQEVGKHKVQVREIAADALLVPAARTRDIKTTVASLRLDAVASSGFGMSRSKLTPAIRSGHVKLNWQSVKSASATVKAGDVISVAGRGRVEVAQILGESKKGRIQLLLKKHV